MKTRIGVPVNKTLGWGLNVYGFIFKFYMLAVFIQQREMTLKMIKLARKGVGYG